MKSRYGAEFPAAGHRPLRTFASRLVPRSVKGRLRARPETGVNPEQTVEFLEFHTRLLHTMAQACPSAGLASSVSSDTTRGPSRLPIQRTASRAPNGQQWAGYWPTKIIPCGEPIPV